MPNNRKFGEKTSHNLHRIFKKIQKKTNFDFRKIELFNILNFHLNIHIINTLNSINTFPIQGALRL